MPQTITLHDIVTHLETMLDDAAAEGAPETADLISKVLFCVSMAATDREIIAKARLTGRIAQAMKYERSADSLCSASFLAMFLEPRKPNAAILSKF